MKTSIVLSTINNPKEVISEYIKNFMENSVDNTKITLIIVSDNKTPPIDISWFKDYIDVELWTPKMQDDWLHKTFPNFGFDEIKRLLIPENDPRRRNFGYLRAIALDSDITIVIDDDNYPINSSNWLGEHHSGLLIHNNSIISSSNKIVNPCNALFFNHEKIFSRGYPLDKMYDNNEYFLIRGFNSNSFPSKKSVLNMGLWTNKPDVDAYTNIIYPDLRGIGFKNSVGYFEMEEQNYSPINSQNTSFLTKEVPIFHNIYQDPTLFHRYDDIWMGLFLQKLAHRMGDTTTFGLPLVEHRRNTHDYNKDLQTEFTGIALNSKMWESVMNMDISSRHYEDGFIEISEQLPSFSDQKINKYICSLKESMSLWVELIDELN